CITVAPGAAIAAGARYRVFPDLEPCPRHRLPGNPRTRAEDRPLAVAYLAVVGGDHIKVAHVGAAERDAGDCARGYFDPLSEHAVRSETRELARAADHRHPH